MFKKITKGNIRLAIVQLQWVVSLYNFVMIFDLSRKANSLELWHLIFPVMALIWVYIYFKDIRPREFANLRRADPEWVALRKDIEDIRDGLKKSGA